MARGGWVPLYLVCLTWFALTTTAQQTEEPCALTFTMGGTQRNRAVFTGLTDDDTPTIGSRLVCSCATVRGLTPLQWLDESGKVLPNNNNTQLVDYRVASSRQPGSTVNLRINKGFSCPNAGNYTCVVGTNTRSVLVTPIGVECGPANVTVTASPTGPVSIGTVLTLECSAEDPTGSGLTYQWLKNGTLISGEVLSTLMVTVMGPKEGGTYTCRVSNRVGQGEASVTVEVIESSSTSDDASHTLTTSSSEPAAVSTSVAVSKTPDGTSFTSVDASNTMVDPSSTSDEASATSVDTPRALPSSSSAVAGDTSGTAVDGTTASVLASTTLGDSPSTSVDTSSMPVETSSVLVHSSATGLDTSGTFRGVSSTPIDSSSTTDTASRMPEETPSTRVDATDASPFSSAGALSTPFASAPLETSSTMGIATGTPTDALTTSTVASSTPDITPSTPDVSSSTPLIAHSTPDVASSTPVVTSSTPDVAFSTPVVTPSTPGVASSIPDITPSTPDVSSSTPLIAHSTPDVASSTPVVTPSTPDVASSTPVVTPSTPDVASSTPVVTPSTPDVASSTPVVTPSTPDVASSTPMVTSTPTDSTTPVVTPSSTTASPRPSTSPIPSPTVDPQMPTDVNVSTPRVTDGAVQITLMWSKPGNDSGLTGYQIQISWERKWDPRWFVKRQSERKTVSVTVTDTSYTLQDAEGFAEYCFGVSALYEGGEESPATDEECTTTPETKPSPPLNLRQVDSSVTTSSVRLQWDAPDPPNGNITHFKVHYQQGSSRLYQVSDWQRQGYVVLDGLDPNTEYYVNVTAATDTLESDISNGLRVVTLVTVPETSDDILVIVIIVVVVVIVILIPLIVVASIVLWVLYRRNKKYEAEETSFSMYRRDEIEMKTTKELENGAEGRAGKSGEGVPGAPSLEVGEQYLDVSAGAPTLVYVNAEGSPTPLVLWKQGEEYLDEERYPVLSGGSLYIPETLPTHQGTYTVSATNANGTVNADVKIDVYQQTPPPQSDGSAVSLDGFPECVARLRAKNEEGFNDEYETLDMEEWHMTTHSSRALVNYPKNRYINIVPYDHSRVVLDLLGELPGSDYINATWVNGYTEPRTYIACQGPLPNYIEDFWRMVWQFRIPTIVIVTNLMEGQKIKCHRYYPESGSQVFGMFTVSLKREECLAEYTVRHLVVEGPRDGQPLHVTQFHFTAWPDHGVPQYATGLLSFRNRVNQHHVLHKGSPMVVHCSAGVGRTGTYISVDILLKKMEAEGIVDVFNVVRQLRWHRKYMVQTVSQYVFVYNAVLEAVMCGETCVSVQGLRKRIEELGERVDGQTRFEVEFERLLATSLEVEFTCDVAARQENVARNRYQTNLPSDTARVVLIGKEEDENDYINASYIDGYYNQRAFLATQGPLEGTTSDFWEMVWDQRSVAIVSLTQLVEDGQELCSQYWPSEVGEAKQFGCLTVKLINEDSPCTEYVVRKLRVWQENKQEEGRLVTQLHFLQWPQGGCPDSATPVVELVNDLQRVQRQSGNRPITVHCSDGVGRTGAFCALVTALERVKTEQIVDVFRTVRTHRIQRSGMVANLSQYKFIYDAVVEYLVSFDNYSNFK